MLIETSATPDKNILNFYPPKEMLNVKSVELKDSKSIRKSPIAENIFDIGEIFAVLITPEMISVTKEENADWEELKPQILAEIMDFIATGAKIVVGEDTSEKAQDNIIQQITGLIDARIRPALKQDGGDIAFVKFENGVVYVELQGNCVGCPYAMNTLKNGVEKTLKTYIPEVKSVKNFATEV